MTTQTFVLGEASGAGNLFRFFAGAIEVDEGLRDGDRTLYYRRLLLYKLTAEAAQLHLDIEESSTNLSGQFTAGHDLNNAFEQNGTITLTRGSVTKIFSIGGTDGLIPDNRETYVYHQTGVPGFPEDIGALLDQPGDITITIEDVASAIELETSFGSSANLVSRLLVDNPGIIELETSFGSSANLVSRLLVDNPGIIELETSFGSSANLVSRLLVDNPGIIPLVVSAGLPGGMIPELTGIAPVNLISNIGVPIGFSPELTGIAPVNLISNIGASIGFSPELFVAPPVDLEINTGSTVALSALLYVQAGIEVAIDGRAGSSASLYVKNPTRVIASIWR